MAVSEPLEEAAPRLRRAGGGRRGRAPVAVTTTPQLAAGAPPSCSPAWRGSTCRSTRTRAWSSPARIEVLAASAAGGAWPALEHRAPGDPRHARVRGAPRRRRAPGGAGGAALRRQGGAQRAQAAAAVVRPRASGCARSHGCSLCWRRRSTRACSSIATSRRACCGSAAARRAPTSSPAAGGVGLPSLRLPAGARLRRRRGRARWRRGSRRLQRARGLPVRDSLGLAAASWRNGCQRSATIARRQV